MAQKAIFSANSYARRTTLSSALSSINGLMFELAVTNLPATVTENQTIVFIENFLWLFKRTDGVLIVNDRQNFDFFGTIAAFTRTDFKLKITRATNSTTVRTEVWDLDDTNYQLLPSYTSASSSPYDITAGGEISLHGSAGTGASAPFDILFTRLYAYDSSMILGQAPSEDAAHSGTLLPTYELEGNLNDSSTHAQHLTGSGTITYGSTLPSAPNAPVLSATPGDTQVTLAAALTSGATGIKYFMRDVGGAFDYTSPLGGGAQGASYVVANLTNGVAKEFVARATNAIGDSADSNIVSATPNVQPYAAPINVAALGGYNGNIIVWNRPDTLYSIPLNYVAPFISYNIYRATSAGGQNPAAPLATGLATPGYEDGQIVSGTQYFYKVTAVNSVGVESVMSAEVSATPTVRALPVMDANREFLLGKIQTLPVGDRRNPFAWHTYYAMTLGKQRGNEFPARPPGANPGEKKTGTVATTAGSNQVTGTGTSFLADFAGLASEQLFIVVEINGIPREHVVASVQSDTQLTLAINWNFETSSGNTWGIATGSVMNSWLENINYYDTVQVLYNNYYRTGDPEFQTLARKCADSWYNGRIYHEGSSLQSPYGYSPPRQISMRGLMLRALDGRPEIWGGILPMATDLWQNWVGARLTYPNHFYGVRDPSYMMQFAACIAKCHPDATVRAEWLQKTIDGTDWYYKLQFKDGSFRWEDGEGQRDWRGRSSQPFHVGLALEAIDLAYRLTNDSRYLEMLAQCAQWLYNKTYRKNAARYILYTAHNEMFPPDFYLLDSADMTNNSDILDRRAVAYTDTQVFANVYEHTGIVKYKEWGDEIFDSIFSYKDGYRANINYSPKQHGEGFRQGSRYVAERFLTPPANPKTTPPSNPTLINLTATSVRIDFDFYGAGQTEFRIESKIGNGSWATVATLLATDRTYTHTGLTTAEERTYRIFALNANGDSLPSREVKTTVGAQVVAQIVVAPSYFETSPGATVQLTAAALDALGNEVTGQTFEFTTSRAEFATVSATGLVTGVAESRAQNDSGVWNPAPVIFGVYIAGTVPTMIMAGNCAGYVRATAPAANTPPTLSVAGLAYNAQIAPDGSLNITATASDDGSIAKVELYQNNTSKKLAIDGAAPYTFTIPASALPYDQTDLFVRAVDNLGYYTDTPQYRVTRTGSYVPTLTTIAVTPSSASIIVGATQQFTAQGLDQYGAAMSPQPTFAWASSDGTKATIDGSGLAIGVAAGTTNITATSGGVTSAASVLTVTSAPAPPPLDPTIRHLGVFTFISAPSAALNFPDPKKGDFNFGN